MKFDGRKAKGNGLVFILFPRTHTFHVLRLSNIRLQFAPLLERYESIYKEYVKENNIKSYSTTPDMFLQCKNLHKSTTNSVGMLITYKYHSDKKEDASYFQSWNFGIVVHHNINDPDRMAILKYNGCKEGR